MTQDYLEQRLREKLPAISPRPGFETRIQALAREPHEPKRKSLFTKLALPAVALVVLVLVLAPREDPAPAPTVVEQTTPEPEPSPIAALKEPVTREYEGLKKDAQWTLGLFRSALPSVPVKLEGNN
ncbi:MAG: hypothetical protein ACPGJR_07465 [Akkermansiaceae bacterium]